MPPRRANSRNVNTWNANARNENTTRPVPDQEVSNAEFKIAIQMFALSVAEQNNQRVQAHMNGNGGSIAARMIKFLCGVSNLMKIECKNAMLLGYINISRLMTHAQQVEGSNLKEHAKENNNARTGNYDSAEKEGCFGCGQSGHRLRDCPSRKCQGGRNGRSQSTTSSAPASLPRQQGNSSAIGGVQRQNKLYALQARQDEEGSLDVFIGTLRVFDLDIYALSDLGATLSFCAIDFSKIYLRFGYHQL
ncbi:uncharacterized protein LOC107003903 [Solanum pennellii]|uniref:Uncharacterized protein LOC107003903 n=1 Tax=Solanum pennellii TaxID=28526 RepID=A0ABM1FJ49_SOLPN|nr:uncharacterized protein LOC107003903 [Solanum pennellii]